MDGTEEGSEFCGITSGEERAQNAWIIIAKENRPLIRQFHRVKLAKMVSKGTQVGIGEKKDAPMRAPAFAEDQIRKLRAGLQSHQIRSHRRHIGRQFPAIQAAVFRLLLVKVFDQIRRRCAIEYCEERLLVCAK